MLSHVLPASHSSSSLPHKQDPNSSQKRSLKTSHSLLMLGALGVVFGDIGTSPLYTFNILLNYTEDSLSPNIIISLVSLLIWTLIIVTSFKYVSMAMRINNNGEGGILALMSLLVRHGYKKPWIYSLGLIGAALLYGDGALTPTISILSSLEGLHLILPGSEKYILPLALVILILLFAVQPFGTSKIGKAFGPVMLVWFIVLAVLGIRNIIIAPEILHALNPKFALNFILTHSTLSFIILGAVFLCVTGAEALYADMGHFGAKPIQHVWYLLVFPSLVLNYAGQGALVMTTQRTDNIFFHLAPSYLVVPLVILATLATIIASQALITGAFSITRQAIQLGWLPNMKIIQTSETGYGQIYIGVINFLLMALTIFLVVNFKTSESLAGAYGISVSIMMLVTTVLLFLAMRVVWKWNLLLAGSICLGLMILDSVFVVSNLFKFFHGGYIPIVFAGCFLLIMFIWRKGIHSVQSLLHEKPIAFSKFQNELKENKIPRVNGVGIFLTRSQNSVPPVMRWHVKRNQSLHKYILSVTVVSEDVPWIPNEERAIIVQRDEHFYHINAHYGFMEQPNIPLLLSELKLIDSKIPSKSYTYYLGLESVMPRSKNRILPKWQTLIFAWLSRNSMRVTDLYQLPSNQVVEIGRRVEL